MRLIDADDLMPTLGVIAHKMAKTEKQQALMGRVFYIIDHKPTIEQKISARQGRWELMEECDGENEYRCSECRRTVHNIPTYVGVVMWDYCPFCGSKNNEVEI